MGPADAGASVRDAGPFEECDRGARPALLVAKVQVIGTGIVEVDRLLDETQPEHGRVEIDRPLRVERADCDVVQSFNGHRSRSVSFSVSRLTRGGRKRAAW